MARPKKIVFTDNTVATCVDKAALHKKIEEDRIYCSQLVKGKFFNIRAPGKSAKLCYHKFKTDPYKWYEFEHGEVYQIPRGFADQLNGIGHDSYKKITYKKSDQENQALEPTQICEPIYQFSPLNF